jgi:hypothetical protein
LSCRTLFWNRTDVSSFSALTHCSAPAHSRIRVAGRRLASFFFVSSRRHGAPPPPHQSTVCEELGLAVEGGVVCPLLFFSSTFSPIDIDTHTRISTPTRSYILHLQTQPPFAHYNSDARGLVSDSAIAPPASSSPRTPSPLALALAHCDARALTPSPAPIVDEPAGVIASLAPFYSEATRRPTPAP